MADSLLSQLAEQYVLYYRPVFTLDCQPLPTYNFGGRSGDDEDEDESEAEDDDDEDEDEDEDTDEEEFNWDEEQEQPYITVNFAHEPPPVRGGGLINPSREPEPVNKPSQLKLFPHDKDDTQTAEVVAEIKSVLSESIQKGKVKKLSPKFLSLCREGIWVFKSPVSRWFLKKISPELGANIRFVVIVRRMLLADDGPSHRCWSKKSGDGKLVPFAQAMKDKLPNLQDVALFFPWDTYDWYCTYAPTEICSLLKDGHIDTVRILCETKSPPAEDWELSDDAIMGRILRPDFPNVSSTEEEGYEEKMEAYKTLHDLFAVTRDEETLDYPELRARYGWEKVQTAFTLRRHDETSIKASIAKRTAAYLQRKDKMEREKEKKRRKNRNKNKNRKMKTKLEVVGLEAEARG